MTEETLTKTKLPMACGCGAARVELDKQRKKVVDLLDPEGRYAEWADRNFLSVIASSLAHDFEDMYFSIESVHMDMWFGLAVTGEGERISIACDTVEDGLVAIWLYLHDKYADKFRMD